METTNKVLTDAMQELQAINHFIPKDTAVEMNKKYQKLRTDLEKEKPKLPFVLPEFPLAITYNKQALIDLLGQDGCVSFRVYPGTNKEEQFALIFVAVDADGNNILPVTAGEPDENPSTEDGGKIVDEGQMSPPYPAPPL